MLALAVLVPVLAFTQTSSSAAEPSRGPWYLHVGEVADGARSGVVRPGGATFAAADDFNASLSALATYMLEIGRAMPEDAYGKMIVPGTRTFGSQLLHIASGLVGITGGLTGDTTPVDTVAVGKGRDEILRIVAASFDHAARIVAQVSDEQLDDRVVWGSRLLTQSTISKRQILAVTRDHMAHHRGQVVVYLRLEGIVPPSYVGF